MVLNSDFCDSYANVLRKMMLGVGDDPDREGLLETPDRVMFAWAEWFDGYDKNAAVILKTFEDGSAGYDELVFQGNIPWYSHCEHHITPFFGVAHIAYIPGNCIVGLSKLSRLVDMFAHRLQVQERMCTQVADMLENHLKPLGLGVVLQARHLCMESRGIRKVGAITTTTALRGNFKERSEVRSEFMSLVMSQEKADIL